MRIARLSSLLLIAALGGCSLLPDGGERSGSRDVRGQAPARQAETAQIATTRESRQCLSELAGLQADFTPLPDRDYGTGCSTNNTVALSQLKLPKLTTLDADYGYIPNLAEIPQDNDVVFTWNGTTSGAKIPNTHWLAEGRSGVTINDATSAIFAMEMDWPKLDATTYSWQKVMGSEAQHGMLVLSPKAVARIEEYDPEWPLPKLFRIKKGGKINTGIFEGATINTPSMLATEDYILALEWAKSIGGRQAMFERADANAKIVTDWIEATPWLRNMVPDPAQRTNTGVCFVFQGDYYDSLSDEEQAGVPKKIAKMLEDRHVGYDFNGYRDAPPSLRIWCGGTVEQEDLKRLLPWIEWAYKRLQA